MRSIDTGLDQLATIAADAGMRAAADYVRLSSVTVTDFQGATEIIREEIRKAVGPALDDAKKALEANTGRMAECTFRASMVEAGIKAGKRIQQSVKKAA